MDIANAYSELNNPIEQHRRFEEEIENLDAKDKKALDTDYVIALEHGMPPTGGLGIGIDRLVMLLAGEKSIKETIAFPMTSSGRTAVMDAPSRVDKEQLNELGIKVKDN